MSFDVGSSRFGGIGRFGKRLLLRALRFLVVRQAAIDDELGRLAKEALEYASQCAREIGAHRRALRELEERLATMSARIGALQQDQRLIHESVRPSLIQARIDELAQRADAQWTDSTDTARRVVEIVRRLDATSAEIQVLRSRLLATPYVSEPLENWMPSVYSTPGAFDYIGFEGLFRGPEALIRKRQSVYLPLVKDGSPILDVGCGRGEFMEILHAAGIESTGIDLNEQMVAYCRSKGIANVVQTDAIEYLASVAPDSLGAVFSAQVIEHLTPDDLLRFAYLSLKCLRPGGVFIAETVNPNSIEGAKTFFVDSSHVKPLFPETMLFLCRSLGYSSVRIFYPNGGGFDEPDPTSQNEFAVVAVV